MATVPSISVGVNDLHLSGAPTMFKGDQISTILALVYFAAGIVAVIAIIIGGIRYTTSNGDSSQIKAAKDTVLYAVIGLVVVIMAAAITQFVIKGIGT